MADKFKRVSQAYQNIKNGSVTSTQGFGSFHDNLRPDHMRGTQGTGNWGTKPGQAPVDFIGITLAQAYQGHHVQIDGVWFYIPPGTRSNTILQKDGHFLRVIVDPHPVIERNGDELVVNLKISTLEAMTGIDIEIDHPSGKTLGFKIPEATDPGKSFRLPGMGMQNPATGIKGDLIVKLTMYSPRQPSESLLTCIQALGLVRHKISL